MGYYLCNIIEISLYYGREIENCIFIDPPLYSLAGFIENNFTVDHEDQKFIIDHCFFFNKIVVS